MRHKKKKKYVRCFFHTSLKRARLTIFWTHHSKKTRGVSLESNTSYFTSFSLEEYDEVCENGAEHCQEGGPIHGEYPEGGEPGQPGGQPLQVGQPLTLPPVRALQSSIPERMISL